MSGDTYLRGVLQKYNVDISGAKAAGNGIYPVIKRWGGQFLSSAEFSGSLAKGTGISLGTDADIFISVSSTTPGTLADLYGSLFSAVDQAGYPARHQNVSIGTMVNGKKIDLVPGRRQSQYGNDHSIYNSKVGTWTKTNINTHINQVKNSNRVDEIRLTKIWRELHKLDFPSFYLELSVIDALKGAQIGDLTRNFLKVLDFLRDDLTKARYADPANTNNIISNDLSASQKLMISSKAGQSRTQHYWEGIVW